MSISFNSGGLITRGYGDDHKIVTRGMSMRFVFVGSGPGLKREYELDILAPILRENSEEIGIYSPLKIRKDEEMSLSSNVSKEIEENLDLSARIDHDKLSEILDAI